MDEYRGRHDGRRSANHRNRRVTLSQLLGPAAARPGRPPGPSTSRPGRPGTRRRLALGLACVGLIVAAIAVTHVVRPMTTGLESAAPTATGPPGPGPLPAPEAGSGPLPDAGGPGPLPDSAPGSMPDSAPGSMPGSGPGSMPGSGPRSSPGSGWRPSAGERPEIGPRPATPRTTPDGALRSDPDEQRPAPAAQRAPMAEPATAGARSRPSSSSAARDDRPDTDHPATHRSTSRADQDSDDRSGHGDRSDNDGRSDDGADERDRDRSDDRSDDRADRVDDGSDDDRSGRGSGGGSGGRDEPGPCSGVDHDGDSGLSDYLTGCLRYLLHRALPRS